MDYLSLYGLRHSNLMVKLKLSPKILQRWGTVLCWCTHVFHYWKGSWCWWCYLSFVVQTKPTPLLYSIYWGRLFSHVELSSNIFLPLFFQIVGHLCVSNWSVLYNQASLDKICILIFPFRYLCGINMFFVRYVSCYVPIMGLVSLVLTILLWPLGLGRT